VHARDGSMRENREIPWSPVPVDDAPSWMVRGVACRRVAGREGNASGGNPLMHDPGKSDSPVLPAKRPNKPGRPGAEAVEGRGLPEGNAASKTRPGRSAGQGAPSALDRVRRIAAKDKDARFTALLHHVDVDRLRTAYWALRPTAAPGSTG
jgi:RNA-directed DNA polymerase